MEFTLLDTCLDLSLNSTTSLDELPIVCPNFSTYPSMNEFLHYYMLYLIYSFHIFLLSETSRSDWIGRRHAIK